MHVRVRRNPAVRHSAAHVAYFHPFQLSMHDELIMAYSIQCTGTGRGHMFHTSSGTKRKRTAVTTSVRQVKRLITTTVVTHT